MILERLEVSRQEFEEATGWALRPEGACRGDVCVPLAGITDGSRDHVDVPAVAERLGMPLIHDDDLGLYALGPASLGGRVIDSAAAPELVLPDLNGAEFRLSALRGQKVVLVGWAPY
jgi:hypothetical protein